MAEISAAQDPDELFDVVTFLGEPTGVTKRRADVHRTGDWRRAIHIWFVSEREGVQSVIFQRRSMAKDTMPGELDPTVGGHFGAGETLEEVFREAEEEIGILVTPEAAIFVGRRVAIGEHTAGIIDHELQDVFFVRDDRPLTHYRPNQHELAGLIQVGLDDLLDLCAGVRPSVPISELSSENLAVTAGTLTLADFRRPVDTYRYRVAIAARAMLIGERHFCV